MQFQNSLFNVYYPKIDNIKRQFVLNEDKVSGFNEATILAIPDEAPNEIPRISLQSEHGHSNITIAPELITFMVNYDKDFKNDWKLCYDYLIDKQNILGDLLDGLSCEVYKFCGLTTAFFIDNDEIEYSNATEYIRRKFISNSPTENLFDLSCRFSYVIEEEYFVNFAIEDARTYETDTNMNQAGFQQYQNGHYIAVVIDINDRYAFNNDPEYSSSRDVFMSISKLMDQEITKAVKIVK